MSYRNLWLSIIITAVAACNITAAPLVIFNPDTQYKNFTSLKKYNPWVKRTKDTATKPEGFQCSMQVETLAQDTAAQYWYIFNGCSWDGKRGDTSALKSEPIEFDFFISPAEALSMPGSQSGAKYIDQQTVLRFCFGSGGRENSIKLLLRRSFFQQADTNGKLQARSDRTGKWLVISISRKPDGTPEKLSVKLPGQDKYMQVPASEYLLEVAGKPNWKSSNFIAIECWGKAIDNFSFNIGRIAIGR